MPALMVRPTMAADPTESLSKSPVPRAVHPAAGLSTAAQVAASAEQEAVAYLADEENSEARTAAARCLAADRGCVRCHEALVASFTREGAFEEARRPIAACLATVPRDVVCLGAAFTLAVGDRDLDRAHELLALLEAAGADATRIDLARGQLADVEHHPEVAVVPYEAACQGGQEYACRRALALRGVE